jgi:hypothetical protein
VRAWRWPALVLIPGLLVAGVVVGQVDEGTEPGSDVAGLAMPEVARPGASSSTWYCAGGTGAGDDTSVAEHLLVLTNAAEADVDVRITAYPSEGSPAESEVSVRASSRLDVRLSDVATAPYVAALVEADGGEVAVAHEVRGPNGISAASCASAPSSSWYFPAGTTRAGAQLVLSLFNPFPTDAVVDLTFEADDGNRSPQAYQGLVVPAGTLLPVDVSAVVTLREQLASRVEVRSGRLVVDQLEVLEPVEPADDEADEGEDEGQGEAEPAAGGEPGALSLVLGAPSAAPMWVFPDGVGAEAYTETYTLFNPGDVPADVDVQVLLDDPDVNGAVEPYQVTVGPGAYVEVDLFDADDQRVPTGVGHATVVRSVDGVGVVAQRTIVGAPGSVQPGLSRTMGAPLLADRWVAAVAGTTGASSASVVVVNPSTTDEVVVTASTLAGGRRTPLDDLDQLRLPPLGRIVVELDADDDLFGRTGLDVVADGPIVVEDRFGFAERGDLDYVLAAPVRGTLVAPWSVVGDLAPTLDDAGG